MFGLAKYVKDLAEPSSYQDRTFEGSREQYQQALAKSCTLYIGNLSFYTTEEQLYQFFGRFGVVKRVIMGLDRNNKTPCGFAFVEYFRRSDAVDCKRLIEGLKLDDRFVRADWDYGFQDGRQYGRGKSGGQVRDEYRIDYDYGRGGYGKLVQEDREQEKQDDVQESKRSKPNDTDSRRYRGERTMGNDEESE